jgi:tetratricopeptide (TPR) repeat protein
MGPAGPRARVFDSRSHRTQNRPRIPELSLRPLRYIRAFALASVVGLAGFAPEPARAADAPTSAPAQSTTTTPTAATPRPVDTEVERHATLGLRLLARGEAQEAIAEFRRAYELRADARFLYDIGEGYGELGLTDQAVFFYQRYLAAAPDAPDRQDVEEQVAALRRQSLGEAPAPTPAPTLARDVVIVPVTPLAPRPLWRRWWAWAAVGAIVAGGLVATFALSREGTDVPATALGDKKFY